ncbi:MAG: PQQ-binding-like beta-propeller repeat protein [Flavobacteriales bacterium]|nr:PQQ-binding-like beta-propeller repeat protein [Flavobacteriales bacterium]MEB2342406.1 hypothetical protein [Flavobacteriia bacterium]
MSTAKNPPVRSTFSMRHVLWSALLTVSLAGCGVLGTQPGQWVSGMFTPDGKYYVYTYSSIFVTQYSRKGNVRHSQGIISFHLQAIECATGRKRYDEAPKLDGYPVIMDVEGDHVWLVSQLSGTGEQGPGLFSLSAGAMKFSLEDLVEINPGIPLANAYNFFTDTARPGLMAVEAGDGRRYAIDPATGKLGPVQGELQRVERKDMTRQVLQHTNDDWPEGISEEGETRKRLVMDEGGISSTDDFIDPELVRAAASSDVLHPAPPLEYQGNIFVLAPMLTGNNAREMQLAMLDLDSLRTSWKLTLPQDEQTVGIYDKERFALVGDRLYLANSSHFLAIDATSGTVIDSLPMLKE